MKEETQITLDTVSIQAMKKLYSFIAMILLDPGTRKTDFSWRDGLLFRSWA